LLEVFAQNVEWFSEIVWNNLPHSFDLMHNMHPVIPIAKQLD